MKKYIKEGRLKDIIEGRENVGVNVFGTDEKKGKKEDL